MARSFRYPGKQVVVLTYVGDVEEVAVTGSSALTTTSYYAGGRRLAQAVNGVFSYLGGDGLGSALAALDGSGNAQASILYDPYGNVRYANGAMPGSYGFTGQHADGATGLDYYDARYYDPVAGQFTSADTVRVGGLNRYAYVGDDPETRTDPSGHLMIPDGGLLRNNDSWWNEEGYIQAHRHDPGIRESWFDTRWHAPANSPANANLRRAYGQEEADGPVLVKYFGLSVIWQDDTNERRGGGATADYIIGLDVSVDTLLPGWAQVARRLLGQPPIHASDLQQVAGSTPADLYYPTSNAKLNQVQNTVRGKHDQAPIVVVDISDYPTLQSMSTQQLEAWANDRIQPRADGQGVPNRVIVIDNRVVVADTYKTYQWGPVPAHDTP